MRFAVLGVLLATGCHLLLPFEAGRSRDGRVDVAADARIDVLGSDRLPDRSAGCDGGCWTFRPSNLAGTPSPPGPECRTLSFSSETTIDTGACAIVGCTGHVASQPSGPSLCVLEVGTLTVSGQVNVKGPNGLLIAAEGKVMIAGIIDASGHGTEPGPGGGAGGLAVGASSGPTGKQGEGLGGGKLCILCNEEVGDDCGGGGGGHGTAGGDGGIEDNITTCPSPGGIPYGKVALVPLTAGSGGASGHNLSNPGWSTPGVGGGGGGAIQISSAVEIILSSVIRAAGAGSQGGVGTGGGGGSGGGVLLEAPKFTGTGTITVAGGGGSGSGTGDSVKEGDGEPGGDGADGPDQGKAQGGVGKSGYGGGGSGGTGQVTPTAGGNGGRGGGGGGAAGRVRVNTPAGTLPSFTINGHGTPGTLASP